MLTIEIFEAAQPGAFQAVALEQNCRVVGAVDTHGGQNRLGAGKSAVEGGNAVGGHQVGALAHLLEHHAQASMEPTASPSGREWEQTQKSLALAQAHSRIAAMRIVAMQRRELPAAHTPRTADHPGRR